MWDGIYIDPARQSFGEGNMQTAKQYGNLGRLYQTTKMFRRSEQMHLKAIKLKETLLGKEDYEVGLSLGHLASLYAYDLKEYQKAEKLYLRSINISISLFGLAYSGLKCDYVGLLQVDSYFSPCCNGQQAQKDTFCCVFVLHLSRRCTRVQTTLTRLMILLKH